jgi:hypothetical protein
VSSGVGRPAAGRGNAALRIATVPSIGVWAMASARWPRRYAFVIWVVKPGWTGINRAAPTVRSTRSVRRIRVRRARSSPP